MHEALVAKVREVFIQTFKLPPAENVDALRLGEHPRWDSLGHMDLVIALESAFSVRFPVHAIAGLTHLEAIAGALEKLKGTVPSAEGGKPK